jgi:DNA helicase II / ATP-dependent DNA helicase PcrA
VKFDYLADLNEAQREAVEHGFSGSSFKDAGPLLVIAGAGSGKTKTLAHRVAHLVVSGADPQRIMLLTFTRRAAEEMGRRVNDITALALGTTQTDLPWGGTFHSIGARLLREHATAVGLNPGFTILDKSDAEDLMNVARHKLGYSERQSRFPLKETCQRLYSLLVNSCAPIKEGLVKHYPQFVEWEKELGRLFAKYTEFKLQQNVLDYDDLLLYWAEIMEIAELAEKLRKCFDHILVDEYQDTNVLQSKILRGLKPNGEGLMVVGDDAQSIYSFRAATIRNILDFPRHFVPAARIVALEQNYRSTQPILDACNAVIGLASECFTKNLRSNRISRQLPFLTTVNDETAQAVHAAEQIIEARENGVALRSQAVLFRASRHSAQLELELARRNIPFVKYGGQKFLETAHVKDIICLMRWCENPNDHIAGFRVLQLLPGIGARTAEKILTALSSQPDPTATLLKVRVPNAATEAWPEFARLVTSLRQRGYGWPAEIGALRLWYEPHLKRIYDDAHLRAQDLVALEQIGASFPTRQKFLTEVMLDPPDKSAKRGRPSPPDEDCLILSTIHSAKGMEWKIVHVLNVVEGLIPSGRAEDLEEERRLLYVAMTRAKDELNLIAPQRIYLGRSGDGYAYASPTQFIPVEIQKLFERRHWGQSIESTQNALSNRNYAAQITYGLKRKWAA